MATQSMSTGVSALLSLDKAIAVQSNNAANMDTMAFKKSKISFADMFYDQKVGLGTKMTEPTKVFSQGELQITNSEYDFAIQGDGFFTVRDPQDEAVFADKRYYTRSGAFQRDKNGLLVDKEDRIIQGALPVVTGDKITSEFTKLISSVNRETDEYHNSINVFVTDYTKTAIETGTSGNNFKPASENIADIEYLSVAYKRAMNDYTNNPVQGVAAQNAIQEIEFPLGVATNNDYTVELVVNGVKFQQDFVDSEINTLKLVSDKINEFTGLTSSVNTTTGVLTVENIVPGERLSVYHSKLNGNRVPSTETQAASGSGQNLIDAIYTRLDNLLTINGGQIASMTTEIAKNQSGTTPTFGDINLDLDALGISDDFFGELENENGELYLIQGEAKFLVARLDTVTVQDKTALNPIGDNLYEKIENGEEFFYVEGMTEVINMYVEASTVKLSEEMVNILTFQKAYEANSKSITTADELLKTALQLKAR